MKIWWQSSTPIHRLDDYRNALVAHLDGVKRGETQIRVSGVDEGSMDLHYNAVVAMNSFAPGGVLNKIIQAAQEGYDAVAIGCFLDPALQEAREVVAIPCFRSGRNVDARGLHVRPQVFGCRVSLEAGAIPTIARLLSTDCQRGTCPSAISGSISGKFRTRSQTRRR